MRLVQIRIKKNWFRTTPKNRRKKIIGRRDEEEDEEGKEKGNSSQFAISASWRVGSSLSLGAWWQLSLILSQNKCDSSRRELARCGRRGLAAAAAWGVGGICAAVNCQRVMGVAPVE